MLSESDIINRIKTIFPNYIGDDTAEINIPKNYNLITTKDLLIENIHFRTSYVTAESLAHKALYTNLSDLAANGANPKFIMLGLAIPKSLENYIYEFIDHFSKICKSEKVEIIGGDTTANKTNLSISVTAIGYSKKNHRKKRNGAKKNNLICIAGSVGKSYLGFLSLEKQIKNMLEFKEHFLFPKAKIKEGIWLGTQKSITSMMDISDGVFIDLKRLTKASEVAAQIDLDKLPLSENFIKNCHTLKLDPFTTLLTGGEDYGLLFTIQNEYFSEISKEFANRFGYQFHCIGKINNGSGVSILKNGKKVDLNLKPFSHFGEKL